MGFGYITGQCSMGIHVCGTLHQAWAIDCIFLSNFQYIFCQFGLILQPIPVWSPTYVIPIVGMLLGNCINGISLSLNSMLTSMVDSAREIELLLSFGASSYEAVSRLLNEAVRTGTMPQLNGMAIIGIISIPGMMTGQILGGSPVREAARYQSKSFVCCHFSFMQPSIS